MGTWNRYFCRKCPYEAFVKGNSIGYILGIAATGYLKFKEIPEDEIEQCM